MKKLAIIISHPIQYYAPIFKLLANRKEIEIKVFYTLGEQANNSVDVGFGKNITWDIDLLTGYNYEWVTNASRSPGSHYFNGIDNPDLINQIDQFTPDAVLVFGWAYNSHLKLLRHYHGKVPIYFRGDSTLLDNKSGIKNTLKSLFLKLVYKKIDYAFYVGTNNRAYFKKYGLKDAQLIYAPHAIDNERFSSSKTAEVSAFRKSLNLLDTDILILFAGKFTSKKNPLLLINTINKLTAYKNLNLLLVGNGDLYQQMTSTITNPQIRLLDFQNQSIMPVVYQACDLFCLPSQGPGETWGLAVNEAMAGGKAVVVSDKCGCAVDLVKPGINGYIFGSDNQSELEEKLMLLCDKKKLDHLGQASAEIIKEFSFHKIATAIESLINEA